jgi:hypothetical protein
MIRREAAVREYSEKLHKCSPLNDQITAAESGPVLCALKSTRRAHRSAGRTFCRRARKRRFSRLTAPVDPERVGTGRELMGFTSLALRVTLTLRRSRSVRQ